MEVDQRKLHLEIITLSLDTADLCFLAHVATASRRGGGDV